jgi:hypothetical protein
MPSGVPSPTPSVSMLYIVGFPFIIPSEDLGVCLCLTRYGLDMFRWH